MSTLKTNPIALINKERCLYKTSGLWSGGWGLFGRSSLDQVELELRAFAPIDANSRSPILQARAALKSLRYQRWNHVALVGDSQRLSWVINGEVSRHDAIPHLESFHARGHYLRLGGQHSNMHALDMRIDDLRITHEALNTKWIQEAYRRRIEAQRAALPDLIDDPPLARFIY